MRVLVACEFSGTVRDQFLLRGHDAISCDLIPSESRLDKFLDKSRHYTGDVRDLLNDPWDLMIAHPPCTHLCVSGARWFKGKIREQEESLEFVRLLMDAPIRRICIENPVGVISTRIRQPDQIIQPWMFGHGEVKSTCLWLKNLPQLLATSVVEGREETIHRMAPSEDRGKLRSISYIGIASAMADQWGDGVVPRISRQVLKRVSLDMNDI